MSSRPKGPRILIAGLGNFLLKDDGVGVHAVRAMKKDQIRGALVAEVGTAVLDGLHLFEWADKVLAIDAMEAGGSPGTIYSFAVAEVADPGPKTSLHELSLLEALRFLPGPSTPQITVLGIEPETIDYGLELSPTVQNVMPRLILKVKSIIGQWRNYSGIWNHHRS